MEKILTSKTKVRFQDCDPFNHLNNSKYIDYLMNAREDHLIQHYNLNVYDEAKHKGISWVVGSNQLLYLSPATNMETVLIETQLIKYSAKNLTVEMKMWDEDKKRLKALLWSTFVHFNLKEKKAHSHNPEFLELFEKVVLPVEQTSFDARSRFLAVQYARAS